jgi:hypothetical protein
MGEHVKFVITVLRVEAGGSLLRQTRCWRGVGRLDPPSVFSTSIPPSTTPSTINDISSLGRRFGSSEPKQPPDGKMRLLSHETRFDLADSLHCARYRDNAEPALYHRFLERIVARVAGYRIVAETLHRPR